MKIEKIYKTFLMSQNGQSTATKLSKVLNNKISHDKITRYLNTANLGEKELWLEVSNNFIYNKNDNKLDIDLILDDTIISKEYRKENRHVCWHYNHAKGRCEKGIQLMSCFLVKSQEGVPINYRIIEKTEKYKDKISGMEKRRSMITKNEYFKEMLKESHKRLKGNYKYVLADNWFCSKNNLKYIDREYCKTKFESLKSSFAVYMRCLSDDKTSFCNGLR